ncbi:unnamed protein product [Rotaria sordida]|uniref:Uncharacterized protein n=1 Tax=Rotaria sordida TaxID=392033 RepID=A0A814JVL0_9BILA|nr:unnamed protein product [Rotaria sordida]CAF0971041.1 unnamed protein product [Rotaria sordida]CAF1043712.1 unnamed protein product [Rotaria sordida]CAF1196699.1 unnamed protein product [Rotaria sordida]CAF3963701.1 unnamed protein product [Rotaria sordida]
MLSLTKGQLAGSVIMLVSCLVFIAIYVYVYIRSLMDERAGFNNSFPRGTHQRPTVVLPEQSWTSQPADATIYPRESINMDTNIIHSHDYSQTIVCPTCDTKMTISDQL